MTPQISHSLCLVAIRTCTNPVSSSLSACSSTRYRSASGRHGSVRWNASRCRTPSFHRCLNSVIHDPARGYRATEQYSFRPEAIQSEMQLQPVGRKYKRRVPTTCTPCYTRKQKVRTSPCRAAILTTCEANPILTIILGRQCDRKHPCAHCTKRRRPEECVYSSPLMDSSSSLRGGVLPLPPRSETASRQISESAQGQETSKSLGGQSTNEAFLALDQVDGDPAAFCDPSFGIGKSFGYFENSQSNTIALLKKVGDTKEDQSDCMCFAILTKLTSLLHPFSGILAARIMAVSMHHRPCSNRFSRTPRKSPRTKCSTTSCNTLSTN